MNKQERIEMLLVTIDRLEMASIRQLQKIHKLGGYRNACRVVSYLKPYVHEVRTDQKILYLNSEGRKLIGSTKEISKNQLTEHTLYRNDVYVYFNCPFDWKTEVRLDASEAFSDRDVFFGGITPIKKKSIVCDAAFNRQGYFHIIEVDHTRHMIDNQKKIEKYGELLPEIRKEKKLNPILYFFTVTEDRKKKLSDMMKRKGIQHEVRTFQEIL